MNTMDIQKNYSIGGKSFAENRSRSSDAAIVAEFNVAAAQPGQLSVRTSNTVGTLTMTNSGHGIVTGQIIDLYWVDPTSGLQLCQRNITVGTVSGTSVPISLGSGSNLPLAAATVAIGIRSSVACAVVGNNIKGAVIYGDVGGVFDFLSSSPTELWSIFLPVTTSGDQGALTEEWDDLTGRVNPLAGQTLATVAMSHSDTTAPRTMRLGVLAV